MGPYSLSSNTVCESLVVEVLVLLLPEIGVRPDDSAADDR